MKNILMDLSLLGLTMRYSLPLKTASHLKFLLLAVSGRSMLQGITCLLASIDHHHKYFLKSFLKIRANAGSQDEKMHRVQPTTTEKHGVDP